MNRQCIGITIKGEQCKLPADPGFTTCGHHRDLVDAITYDPSEHDSYLHMVFGTCERCEELKEEYGV